MSVPELVAVAVGIIAIVGAAYRVNRWVLSRIHKTRRDDEALARIARWFPDEHPNGEESLPAQVSRLHRGMDSVRDRLEAVERAVGVSPQRRGW